MLTITAFVPSRFTGIKFQTNTITLTATGSVGEIYNVQGTTNVIGGTNWVTLGSCTNTGGTFQFTDTSATNISQRFYRLQIGP
jgi:hypothetical protein